MQVVLFPWQAPIYTRFYDHFLVTVDDDDRDSYREVLLKSSYTLCPVGTADDCFRFWEAIEAGSIPIFVRRNPKSRPGCPDAFEDVLATNPPIVILDSWEQLPEFAASVTESQINQQRIELARWNREWWENVTQRVTTAVTSALSIRKEMVYNNTIRSKYMPKTAWGALQNQARYADRIAMSGSATAAHHVNNAYFSGSDDARERRHLRPLVPDFRKSAFYCGGNCKMQDDCPYSISSTGKCEDMAGYAYLACVDHVVMVDIATLNLHQNW